jgi:PEGA domain-containing protein
MSRTIALLMCAAALAACSALPGLPGSESKAPNIALESTPPGADVSFAGGTSCRTPCQLPAPGNNGTYHARFTLAGHQPTSVAVKVATGKEHWYSGETTTVEPTQVVAKLEPIPPPAKKKPTIRKPKPAAQAAPKPAAPAPAAAAPAPAAAPSGQVAAPSASPAPPPPAPWPGTPGAR